MEPKFNDECDRLRATIKQIGMDTHALMGHSVFGEPQAWIGQHGETKANIMLAYRHLEDARMRLGKVLQAHDGGVSCDDK
jgi:hypothetical protein